MYCYQYGETDSKVPLFIDEKYIDEVSVVSNGEKVEFDRDGDKIWMTIPKNAFIHSCAVVEVKLNKTFEEVQK